MGKNFFRFPLFDEEAYTSGMKTMMLTSIFRHFGNICCVFFPVPLLLAGDTPVAPRLLRTVDVAGAEPSDGIAFSTDQHFAAVGRRSGPVEIWNLQTGALEHRLDPSHAG